jgi:hypothetical protein
MLSPVGRPVSLSAAKFFLLIAGVLQLATTTPAMGQESGDRSRGLWDKTFETARARIRKPRKDRLTTQDTTANALIGITIWRLRSSEREKPSQKARSLEHKLDPSNLVAERVETQTVFQEGDWIRIGVEVPHDGFLYVIDREVYSDGSLGDPFLIFPTRYTRGGDNKVYPGRPIEIPAQTDRPPYFTFEKNRKDQVSDRLTIIVSPRKLPLELAGGRARLEREQVAKWETQWGGPAEHREAVGGAGKRRTRAEQLALAGRRLLGESDPLPQTIYKAPDRPGLPLLITVPLRIAP